MIPCRTKVRGIYDHYAPVSMDELQGMCHRTVMHPLFAQQHV